MSLPLWEAMKILSAREVFNAGRVEEAERVVAEAEKAKVPVAPEPPKQVEEVEDPEVRLPEIP